MERNWLDIVALILIIIGAINWGLIGFFRFDLIASLFGQLSAISRIIYAIVGIAGIYSLILFWKLKQNNFVNYLYHMMTWKKQQTILLCLCCFWL